MESKNFIVIYRSSHAHLVSRILTAAERALVPLSSILDYQPSDKIIINTNDFSDYGSAGATTVPHNFIRLEIEPLELGYENIPFNERMQWLLAHELVHIVVNDRFGSVESFLRSAFSGVPPEKQQPLSILYSLLTNSKRYSPRWYQEGIAVFMETWLSGGYGRILGNFDEMYFRSLVWENKSFANPTVLDGRDRESSLLLELVSYLYGARFNAYLAATYGPEKLLQWYARRNALLQGFEANFTNTFGLDLHSGWAGFVESEKQFQTENLKRLQAAALTPVRRIQETPMGWVTQPYPDSGGRKILFGNHQAHRLTAINLLDRTTGEIEKIGSLPTPSIIQVASTAYDVERKLFFYTTNNNRLYRDIWVLDLKSGENRALFKNARVGNLTVSSRTRELWGVRHSGGQAYLVYSMYPYKELKTLIAFNIGDALQHLAISPSGALLAATLHQASGRQAIIVSNVAELKETGRFQFRTISEEGSPEFPSWSPDENAIYWNAFTNGVSNLYRYMRKTAKTEAMSHTLRGLFRPVYLSSDSLFAFEFSTDGFLPAVLANRPTVRLPAIRYYGQKIIERAPHLTEWTLKDTSAANSEVSNSFATKGYSGISHLRFQSIFPMVSGFRNEKVVGLYTHLSDPLFTHDLTFEMGVSPFTGNPGGAFFHFKGKYEYKKTYRLEFEHNAPNFYDLFNDRKAGTNGTQITLGNTHYWKFDLPHQVKQTTDITFYTGIQAINENLISVNFPDFFIFETSTNSRNIRRSIGSVGSESGVDWTVTLLGLGTRFSALQAAGGVHTEWSFFNTFGWPHNVLHLKLAGGYLRNPDNLAIGKFYFGGFGNQNLEDEPVKQYRDSFRFPGLPVYSLAGERFGKVMLEHNLPPLRFGNVRLSQHMLTRIDASWFAQALLLNSGGDDKWANLGGQVNFRFKHWFNLETTLSTGVAKAWNWDGGSDSEWFLSLKLLRD